MTDTLEISVLSRAKLKRNLVNSDKCIYSCILIQINKQSSGLYSVLLQETTNSHSPDLLCGRTVNINEERF